MNLALAFALTLYRALPCVISILLRVNVQKKYETSQLGTQ